jgi:hypothetical protein
MDLVPDPGYENLLRLSYFAKLNQSSSKFDLLRDALRKYQWAMLASHSAEHINKVLMDQVVDKHLLLDPNGSMEFSRAVFELVTYGKSSLDSLAQFASEYFSLAIKPQECDFKWSRFREKFEHLGIQEGLMDELNSWLDKNSVCTDSIAAMRDKWIHRGFIVLPFLWPPNELGCFGVPKSIDLRNRTETKFSREFFVPVDEFLELHRSRLTRLLFAVVERVAELESQGRPYKVPEHSAHNKMSFFPIGVTAEASWRGFKIGPFSAD